MSKKTARLIPSILLYIFAILMLAYTIWSYTWCADIIAQARAAGQLATGGNEFDIASFYMGNCGQYLTYALLLAAAGLLLQIKQPAPSAPGGENKENDDTGENDDTEENEEENEETGSEETPDEWFDEE